MGRRPIKGGSGKLTQSRVVFPHKESHGSCLVAQCSHDDFAQRERDACMFVHQRFGGAYRASPRRSERSLAYLGSSQSRVLSSGSAEKMHYLRNASTNKQILYTQATRELDTCMNSEPPSSWMCTAYPLERARHPKAGCFQAEAPGSHTVLVWGRNARTMTSRSESEMLVCLCTKGSGAHIAPLPADPSAP